MYKVSLRLNFSASNHHDTTKCDLPQEAIDWINKNLGILGPISTRNVDRIMNMVPVEKVKFKIACCSVSVTCK